MYVCYVWVCVCISICSSRFVYCGGMRYTISYNICYTYTCFQPTQDFNSRSRNISICKYNRTISEYRRNGIIIVVCLLFLLLLCCFRVVCVVLCTDHKQRIHSKSLIRWMNFGWKCNWIPATIIIRIYILTVSLFKWMCAESNVRGLNFDTRFILHPYCSKWRMPGDGRWEW